MASEESASEGQPLHRGVICDLCAVAPIKGTRYFCTDCGDYDLCQECYDKKPETYLHSNT